MTEPALDLPDPEDSFDEKLIADIKSVGWHCVQVANEHHPEHADENAALGPHPIYDAAFSYTVGLSLTRSHPELVLVGRWKHAHAILASAVLHINEGVRYEPGSTSDEILEGYRVCFTDVSPESREELLTYASWANRRATFDALQLVVPDASGRWPWDRAYDSLAQPLLTNRRWSARLWTAESADERAERRRSDDPVGGEPGLALEPRHCSRRRRAIATVCFPG